MMLLLVIDQNLLQVLNGILDDVINVELTPFPISSIFLLPLILFTVGVIGVVLNKKNLIFLLLSLELMLLAATLNFIFFSLFLNSEMGQIFALVVLTVAAAESAIGLGILVVIFRVKGTTDFNNLNYLRG